MSEISTEAPLRRTPLYAQHVALGAHVAPFGGWEMPIDYGSIIEEHKATRLAAGLFDLSHMGEFFITGPGALDLVNLLITNDATPMPTGQGLYAPMCRDDGTIVDDVIVYHLPGPVGARYLMVVNAANIDKDWDWALRVRLEAGLQDRTWLENSSDATALIAIQGPHAVAITERISDTSLSHMRSFALEDVGIGGIPARVARTGYTGEDGFEIFIPADSAVDLWKLLLAEGKDAGLRPVGLGARDTLRLEARLPLYGNDIDDTTNPLEAGLGRWVKLEKPAFRGREALLAVQQVGPSRKLVGLAMADRSVPRAHYPVLDQDGAPLGQVTSGTFSPTLARGIALAYVPVEAGAIGTPLQIQIRTTPHPATVVKTPFYRRQK